MKFSKIDGMKVFSSDAFMVGEVSGAEINAKKWEVTHLYIELSDDAATKLGYKKPLIGHITICVPVGYVKTVGDVVTFNRTIQELTKMPECE